MNVIQTSDYTEIMKSDLIISIDGAKAKTEDSFLTQIYDRLFFSDPEYMNWDAYIDWMKDLSWISENRITIFVYNWTDFLSSSSRIDKETFISDYEDDIFQFWEEEMLNDPDDEKIKQIKVFYSIEDGKSLIKKMNLVQTNAAIYYAKGYMNRVYKMDVIAGFEKNGQWVFSGGDKTEIVYGNPRIAITRENTISSLNISIRDLLKLSKDAQVLNI